MCVFVLQKVDPELIFTKQERIGKGSFGEVFKGIDNRTQQVVAIKIIDLEEAEDEIEDIQQEIMVLSQCDSPYVTKYYGSYLKVSIAWFLENYAESFLVWKLFCDLWSPSLEFLSSKVCSLLKFMIFSVI